MTKKSKEIKTNADDLSLLIQLAIKFGSLDSVYRQELIDLENHIQSLFNVTADLENALWGALHTLEINNILPSEDVYFQISEEISKRFEKFECPSCEKKNDICPYCNQCKCSHESHCNFIKFSVKMQDEQNDKK